MRVGLISYPMLFQRIGGLQVQVTETLAALRDLGVDAFLFDNLHDRLPETDLLHVFSVLHGNDRIIEAARQAGVPVVLSTILQPPYSAIDHVRADVADRIAGRLTGWRIRTTHAQTMRALDGANHVVALGDAERDVLVKGYRQSPEKISIVPNGVNARYYSANRALFDKHFPEGGTVAVCIASISPNKNQVTAAKAFRSLSAKLHLIGPCAPDNKSYLDSVLASAPGRIHYHGSLRYDDPLLPSAYAAASLSILVSESEVMPISVLESLAAGTPVLMGLNHSLGIAPVPGILEMVRHDDVAAVRNACEKIMATPPPRNSVRDIVRQFDWSTVAKKLFSIYQRLMVPG